MCLSGGGGVLLIPQKGGQLMWIAGWGQAGLAGADHGEGLIRGEMRQSLFEGTGEMELRSFRSNAQDGFAEAVDAVRGGF